MIFIPLLKAARHFIIANRSVDRIGDVFLFTADEKSNEPFLILNPASFEKTNEELRGGGYHTFTIDFVLMRTTQKSEHAVSNEVNRNNYEALSYGLDELLRILNTRGWRDLPTSVIRDIPGFDFTPSNYILDYDCSFSTLTYDEKVYSQVEISAPIRIFLRPTAN